jgi:hypothetical protein
VVQDTDSTNNLADHLGLAQTLDVGGVTDDKGCFGLLAAAADANNLARLEQDLVNVRVEHVGAAVDSAQSAERLWQTTKTIDWVEERRVTVLAKRVHVKSHLANRVNRGLLEIRVITMECNSVSKEINSVLRKTVGLEHFAHRHFGDVMLTPGGRVFIVDLIEVQVKVSAVALLEDAHEGRL